MYSLFRQTLHVFCSAQAILEQIIEFGFGWFHQLCGAYGILFVGRRQYLQAFITSKHGTHIAATMMTWSKMLVYFCIHYGYNASISLVRICFSLFSFTIKKTRIIKRNACKNESIVTTHYGCQNGQYQIIWSASVFTSVMND